MRFLVILCFGLFWGLMGCAEKEQLSDELIVAMDMSFPPFEGVGPDGKPYGISVDLAHDLALFLGKTVNIVNMKWEGLIPSLYTKQCDIILSSMSITPEREKVIDFSIPYGRLGIEIVTRKDFVFKDVQSLNDPKIRINVRLGTVSDLVGTKMFPNSNLTRLVDFDSAVLEVLQNKSDIALMDPLTAFQYSQKYQGNLMVHYESLGTVPVAIAVRKTKNKAFLKKLNNFLTEYKRSGKMALLAEKYLSTVKQEFEKQGRSFTMLF